MSDVRVVEAHNCTPKEAIGKIAEFEAMLKKKYGVKPKWKGTHATIKNPGVKGSIVVDDANVTVELSLGLMARALKIDPTRLEASIRKRLKSAFLVA